MKSLNNRAMYYAHQNYEDGLPDCIHESAYKQGALEQYKIDVDEAYDIFKEKIDNYLGDNEATETWILTKEQFTNEMEIAID